jgi:hypothetical protein
MNKANSRTVRVAVIAAMGICALVVAAITLGINFQLFDRAANARLGIQAAKAPGEIVVGEERSVRSVLNEEVESESTIQAIDEIESLSLPAAIQPAHLQSEIESTLAGHMDPGAFLDAALALTKLEVSDRPIPEPHPNGAIRYPILGTPEGVTAELWVRGAKTQLYSSPVLTYNVEIGMPEGYVFEGAVRRHMTVQITVWNDKQGEPKRFDILTDSRTHYDSNWLHSQMPTGAAFSVDIDNPNGWVSANCGTLNGIPYDSNGSPVTLLGKWPRTEDIKLLGSGLLNVHSKL